MHQTIGRIAGKPNDYKKCPSCNAINWYENETCVNCDCSFTLLRARDFTEKDAEQLLRELDDSGLDDEIELEV